jgi:2'-5' RNA ligase
MRVFAGLPVAEAVIPHLLGAIDYLKQNYPDMNFIKSQGMHITIQFFGEISEKEALSLIKLMDEPLIKIFKIKAKIGSIGSFPVRGNPRVVFASLEEGNNDIILYYKTFHEIISRLGYEEDNRDEFVPHITLARNKGARIEHGFLRRIPLERLSFAFDRVVLYKSVLKPTGAEYSALKTVFFD